MCLTILIFPTLFLQANVALTLKMEKLDMLCNIFSLVVNVLICVIGLSYKQDLSIVNFGLFGSFLVFHIIQDIMLVRKKITTIFHVVGFYTISILTIGGYILLSEKFGNMIVFPITWIAIGLLIFIYRKKIIALYKS